jgi:putative spermidine/putrescine transport system permease protein
MGKNKLIKNSLYSYLIEGMFFLLVLLLLLAPIIVLVAVSFNPETIEFPPKGFSFRWYKEMFERKDFINSIYTSFSLAFLVALISTIIAIPTSLALTRYRFWGKELLNSIINSPTLVPTVLIGLALFQFFISIGIYGSFLALIIGHIVITLPFPIRIICASLRAFNPFWEEAARCVGATESQTFIKITLPLLRQGIFGGVLFAFIISWNNFPVSLFLASAKMITLPVQLYGYLRYEYKPLITAISTTIVFFSGLLIIIMDRFLGIESLFVKSK